MKRTVYMQEDVRGQLQSLALLAREIPNPQRRAGYELALQAMAVAFDLGDICHSPRVTVIRNLGNFALEVTP